MVMDPSLLPCSVFLFMKSGGGDRVLFRYPYSISPKKRQSLAEANSNGINESRSNGFVSRQLNDSNKYPQPKRANLYTLPQTSNTGGLFLSEDTSGSVDPEDCLQADSLPAFPSKDLANLFAVSSKLCGEKFELKINDVRFVGHPVSMEVRPEDEIYLARKQQSSMSMFHIVFALRATSDYSVVECFHDLSQQIGVAIRYEERRCSYFTNESKTMSRAQEEMASRPEDKQTSPFSLALERSQLAQDLRQIYEDISHSGVVYVRINKYIEVSYCIPQKVFKRLYPHLRVEPESIFSCLEALRPYHGMLLLYEEKELLDQFPLDASPALRKLIRQASPSKSFRVLACDTDLSLRQVFHLAGHLLYWGKATVIYPVCENNVYVISPRIANPISGVACERFSEKFPGETLMEMLSIFSLPTTISQRSTPMYQTSQINTLMGVVVWFLQEQYVVQIHTYITIALNSFMKFNFEDPLEKRFKKPTVLDERLNGFLEGAGERYQPDSLSDETLTYATAPENISEVSEFDEKEVEMTRLMNQNFTLLSNGPTPVPMTTMTPPATPKKANGSAPQSPLKKLDFSKSGETSSMKDKTKEKLSPSDSLLQDLCEAERNLLMSVPSANNVDDLKLFLRVAKYFNGKYHLEEIMYHENLRRSQLMQIIDKFRSVLVRHEHEDPAVTMYFRK